MLPQIYGGSAPALQFSGPARRSLTFRPAWSLNRPPDPSVPGASNHVVAFMIRPDRHQPRRRLLGGVRTRQGNAPFHGARIFSCYCLSVSFCRSPIPPNREGSSAPAHRRRRTRTDSEGVSVSVVGTSIRQSRKEENPNLFFKSVVTIGCPDLPPVAQVRTLQQGMGRFGIAFETLRPIVATQMRQRQPGGCAECVRSMIRGMTSC